jgi:hypothetical protein
MRRRSKRGNILKIYQQISAETFKPLKPSKVSCTAWPKRRMKLIVTEKKERKDKFRWSTGTK